MTRQRGISLIELIIVGAFLAMVVSAAAYGAKAYGVLGLLVGLAAGAGIPIAVLWLKEGRGRAAALGRRLLPLLPFVLVVAHLLRPEVFLLRLAAVAWVLMVGEVLSQGMHAWISSRGKTDEFTLHFGWFLLVVVVGTVLAIWWGWISTGIVLLGDGALLGVSGLVERKSRGGLPTGGIEPDRSSRSPPKGFRAMSDTSRIIEALTIDGHSLDELFIVDGLPMYIDEVSGEVVPNAIVIEDDALAAACIDFLKGRGTKQFDSWENFEKWRSSDA